MNLYKTMAELQARVGGHAPNEQWSRAQRLLRFWCYNPKSDREVEPILLQALTLTAMGSIVPSQAVDKAAGSAMLRLAGKVHDLLECHRERNSRHQIIIAEKVRWMLLSNKVFSAWRRVSNEAGPYQRANIAALRMGALDAARLFQSPMGEKVTICGEEFRLEEPIEWLNVIRRRLTDLSEDTFSEHEIIRRASNAIEWRRCAYLYRLRSRWVPNRLSLSAIEERGTTRGCLHLRHIEGAIISRMATGERGMAYFEERVPTFTLSRDDCKERWLKCVRAWILCGGSDIRLKRRAMQRGMTEERSRSRANMLREQAQGRVALIAGLGSNMQPHTTGTTMRVRIEPVDLAKACMDTGKEAALLHLRTTFDNEQGTECQTGFVTGSQTTDILDHWAEKALDRLGSIHWSVSLNGIRHALHAHSGSQTSLLSFTQFRKAATAQVERASTAFRHAGLAHNALRLDWQAAGDLAARALAISHRPRSGHKTINRLTIWDRPQSNRQGMNSELPSTHEHQWFNSETSLTGPLVSRLRLRADMELERLNSERTARQIRDRQFHIALAGACGHDSHQAWTRREQTRLVTARRHRLSNRPNNTGVDDKGSKTSIHTPSRGSILAGRT